MKRRDKYINALLITSRDKSEITKAEIEHALYRIPKKHKHLMLLPNARLYKCLTDDTLPWRWFLTNKAASKRAFSASTLKHKMISKNGNRLLKDIHKATNGIPLRYIIFLDRADEKVWRYHCKTHYCSICLLCPVNNFYIGTQVFRKRINGNPRIVFLKKDG